MTYFLDSVLTDANYNRAESAEMKQEKIFETICCSWLQSCCGLYLLATVFQRLCQGKMNDLKSFSSIIANSLLTVWPLGAEELPKPICLFFVIEDDKLHCIIEINRLRNKST